MIACLTGFFAPFPSFTLTLPGIAGIILSIGMGVDANVITSERIKEELRNGKTLDGAIDSGFQRTFAAIFDGNITMVLVAIILMGAFGPPSSIFGTIFSPIFRWFGASATRRDLLLRLYADRRRHLQLHHGRHRFPPDAQVDLQNSSPLKRRGCMEVTNNETD